MADSMPYDAPMRSAGVFRPWLLLVLVASTAHAHTVPSLTLEAQFESDGRYLIKANVDPRLFLAAVPSNVPPVPASWYFDQSLAQRQDTEAKASAYLHQTVQLHFGGRSIDLPAMTWTAMDGAANEALKPDSAETHLLAEIPGLSPAADLRVHLPPAANTSVILLTRIGSTAEQRPIVLFPGEASPVITVPVPPATTAVRPARLESGKLLMLLGMTVLALAAILRWRKMKASP